MQSYFDVNNLMDKGIKPNHWWYTLFGFSLFSVSSIVLRSVFINKCVIISRIYCWKVISYPSFTTLIICTMYKTSNNIQEIVANPNVFLYNIFKYWLHTKVVMYWTIQMQLLRTDSSNKPAKKMLLTSIFTLSHTKMIFTYSSA